MFSDICKCENSTKHIQNTLGFNYQTKEKIEIFFSKKKTWSLSGVTEADIVLKF